MNMKNFACIGMVFIMTTYFVSGQNEDQLIFRISEPGFYQNTILKEDRDIRAKISQNEPNKSIAVDLTEKDIPNKVNLYPNQQWRNPPISQGNTGTCWCYATTSLLESEVYRLHNMKVKLSEAYTVYWEYVEKARRYIRERGDSYFSEGSEANAVTRIWRTYGALPAEAYSGLLEDRIYPNHGTMVEEITTYLEFIETNAAWDEEAAIATIKSILNHYMGEPPATVEIKGKEVTPLQYMKEVIRINPDDYVDILSYMQEPFYEQVEYKVPDNWWHNADYYNVPLEEFMSALKQAVRNGYTVSIGGDVSEPGFDRTTQSATIPDFDIPTAYINDDARQFRFSNQTTTDDHGMHLVGYLEKDGKDWYLIKDSSSGSRNNDPEAAEFGYYFFSEDYVKLKMMDFMVHKDAVEDILQQFK